MKKIKEIISKNKLVVLLRIIGELIQEFKMLSKFLGAVNTKDSQSKWEADLIIKSHAIEKGLSMECVRLGFGQEKVEKILDEITEYKKYYSNTLFIEKINAILNSYFCFNKNSVPNCLIEKYKATFKECLDKVEGGTYLINNIDIKKATNIDFDSFLKSRYAIRDFDNTPVNIDLIYKAIEMAKKTPSACNRQPWGVYIYTNEFKKDILRWQGNKGFIENIQVVVVVTSSLESFFINEIHQAYIDGGLYAMTLLLCLHSVGLGTIPLTLGMMSSKNKALYTKFGISKKEVPILMIGIGNTKNEYKVAVSNRKDIKEYIKIFE